MRLDNGKIYIEVSPFGAELKRIKMNGIEYLWGGDPKFWKRNSPVLFPIVGRLLDNEYRYKGEVYSMSQHGFARDNEFELVSSTSNSVLYSFTSTLKTKEVYPFEFELKIGYELVENKIIVSWEVKNIGDTELIFGIGAHPAFNFLNGSIIEVNRTTNIYMLQSSPYIHSVQKDVSVESIIIDDSTFVEDAIILENIDSVTLKDEEKSVSINCESFPYIGLWSSVNEGKNAPFVCLEPWHGITDFYNHNKQLEDKVGMNKLIKGASFKASYEIILG